VSKACFQSRVYREHQADKYIRYHETKPLIEELWDIQKDPLELNNLVNDSSRAAVLSLMRQKCDEYIQMAESEQN